MESGRQETKIDFRKNKIILALDHELRENLFERFLFYFFSNMYIRGTRSEPAVVRPAVETF